MDKKSPSTTWLTTDEAISYLGCCKKTLYNYRRDGLLTYHQVGRKIFYKMDDLNSFLDNYRIEAIQ